MSKQRYSLALAVFTLGQSFAIDMIGRMDQRVQNGEDPNDIDWEDRARMLEFIGSIASGECTPVPGELDIPQAERREMMASFVAAAKCVLESLEAEAAAD